VRAIALGWCGCCADRRFQLLDTGADLATNRALWTIVNSAFSAEHGRRAWTAADITWGLFHVPESDVGVLGNVRGLDVIELGCGNGIFVGVVGQAGRTAGWC
jgi:hypothetical protein